GAHELRVDAPDALRDRRVRGEQAREPHAYRLAEEHVRDLLGVAAGDIRAGGGGADLVERAGDAIGVARELHARGVGEEFALARHRRLDEARGEEPDVTDEEEREAG